MPLTFMTFEGLLEEVSMLLVDVPREAVSRIEQNREADLRSARYILTPRPEGIEKEQKIFGRRLDLDECKLCFAYQAKH